MAADPDRLSALPDDLLHRILGFTPAREAASTAALSRRWRGLWPTPAAAVTLDTGSYDRNRNGGGDPDPDRFDPFSRCDIDRDAFFRDAGAALAAHAAVRRLSVRVEANYPGAVDDYMSPPRGPYGGEECYVAADVLPHPSCRAVEELAIDGVTSCLSSASITARRAATFRKLDESTAAKRGEGNYRLSLGCVPSAALRVLHISNCKDLTLPGPAAPPGVAAAAFPCLAALRLERCTVSLYAIQDMVVAAPRLTTLHLERVYITTKVCRPTTLPEDDRGYDDYWGGGYSPGVDNYGYGGCYGYNYDNGDDLGKSDNGEMRVESLCCPGVTSAVLVSCSCRRGLTIELDMPRVQSFRYRGSMAEFALRSPLLEVQRADLHFFDGGSHYGDEDELASERFWLYMRNFGNTKFLKLKLDLLMGEIAVADKKRHEELPGGETLLFGNLDRLEVIGQYKPGSDDVAVAIGNLLQCCPVLRDFRLKLNTFDRKYGRTGYRPDWSERLYKSTFLERKWEMDTRKSVDHFERRRKLGVCLGGGGDDGDLCKVSAIPGLSDKWFNFNCLRGYLRRVSLQFRMDRKSDSFGIQLAKFFSERAMVLEEMYIDDGNHKMCEHINRKVSGCPSNASQPCSEYQVSAGISQLFGANDQLNSAQTLRELPHTKEEDRRRNWWSTSFRILPLER